MAKSRTKSTHTRESACATVAKDLREFGYLDCTGKMIESCLAAWLSGKRDAKLPHGVVGMFASRQFDEIEQAKPGWLASLQAVKL